MDRRAELKLEYKNKPKNIGIYQIKNKINGKILLGSALNLDAAFSRFQFELKYGSGMLREPELIRDLNEYGSENFSFEILDQLKPNEDPLYNYKEDLKTLEELWLEKLQPYDEKGYNQRK
jgi:group I intron endonuclease